MGTAARIAIMYALESLKENRPFAYNQIGLASGNVADYETEVPVAEMNACPLLGRRFMECSLTMLLGPASSSIIMASFDVKRMKQEFDA